MYDVINLGVSSDVPEVLWDGPNFGGGVVCFLCIYTIWVYIWVTVDHSAFWHNG